MEHWAAFPAEIEPSSSSNPSSSRQGEVQKSEKDKAYEKFMAEEKKVLSHVHVVNDVRFVILFPLPLASSFSSLNVILDTT